MTDFKEKDYYELLGVPREAETEQIKIAYRDLARVYHPDSNFYAEIIDTPVTPRDEEIFKLVTAAYDTLMDPEKRARYDATLLRGVPKWTDEEKHEAEAKPIHRPEARPSPARPMPARGSNQQAAEPRPSFGRVAREDYVSVSSMQRARPVADLLQSTRRTLADKLLLFIGLGLPLITLAAVAIYLLWFARKT
ncbi:MAG: J domain-containing protein [Deltaproteobacteria bacterium]|nr:J domain-containing protein [Deltaproteobacteria bacterium]